VKHLPTLTVASVSPLLHPIDPQQNIQTVHRWAKRAADQRADLVLFPELFITGYVGDVMDKWPAARKRSFFALAEPIPGPSTRLLEEIADEFDVHLCAGLLERGRKHLYNTQVMIAPREGYMGSYRKVHVAHREAWFSEPGNQFPIFHVKGVPTGILICRDKSFPEAARILALKGAQLLLNPHSTTASPGSGFAEWSLKLCVARAMENGCYLIANNPVFNASIKPNRQAGCNFAIDPFGKVVHCDKGPGDRPRMAVVKIDLERVRLRREGEGPHFNLWSRRPSTYRKLSQLSPKSADT